MVCIRRSYMTRTRSNERHFRNCFSCLATRAHYASRNGPSETTDNERQRTLPKAASFSPASRIAAASYKFGSLEKYLPSPLWQRTRRVDRRLNFNGRTVGDCYCMYAPIRDASKDQITIKIYVYESDFAPPHPDSPEIRLCPNAPELYDVRGQNPLTYSFLPQCRLTRKYYLHNSWCFIRVWGGKRRAFRTRSALSIAGIFILIRNRFTKSVARGSFFVPLFVPIAF